MRSGYRSARKLNCEEGTSVGLSRVCFTCEFEDCQWEYTSPCIDETALLWEQASFILGILLVMTLLCCFCCRFCCCVGFVVVLVLLLLFSPFSCYWIVKYRCSGCYCHCCCFCETSKACLGWTFSTPRHSLQGNPPGNKLRRKEKTMP